ncbi:DUF2849 domain-containing protein [Pararhodobacter oceanensis]|uniref:DUF2849 domain-containing protein n=1 Tax=Pararhodobacter oceanensis TaxID=2172121 RepID=UPI003A907089
MSRESFPQIVTANALIEGDVVYLTEAHGWTRELSEALVLTNPTDAELALAEGDAQVAQVVGCYLANVRLTASGPQPVHFREDFRRRGPSNYAHGKQAEGSAHMPADTPADTPTAAKAISAA